MQVECGGGSAIDAFEETDELLLTVARHAVADDLAVEQA
jgi:hypothetical protein